MSDTAGDASRCSLCGRDVPKNLMTLHHLTPKQKGGKAEHRTPMCKPCHKQLHATFSNKVAALLAHRSQWRSTMDIEAGQPREAEGREAFAARIRSQALADGKLADGGLGEAFRLMTDL